ncbi:hypothetical protein GCM10020331_067700 [Ectobacillus funiculus]
MTKLEETVAAMKPAVSSVLIISDEAVASRYLDDVTNAIHSDLSVYSFVVPSGEKEKNLLRTITKLKRAPLKSG